MIRGSEYYAVFYENSYGERELDVVTNDFNGWLKATNKSRVDEGEEPYDADEFELEDVATFFREEKGKYK
tara:strand:- start:798 stop:1007 length:210 start_codon:yes stop_codon:yes gene_type:complete